MNPDAPAEVETEQITILLPAGRLPLAILAEVSALAAQHGLAIYLTTLQNLRLLGVPIAVAAEIRERLSALGVEFKAPGKFPVPRICIGSPYCSLGLIDTKALSDKILARFSGRAKTKAKLKIAISGCILSCSGTRTSDIGIVAVRHGYDVYAGGKGGAAPKIGRRILKEVPEDEVLAAIETLIDFHDSRTVSKQRMIKLIDDPGFPFAEV
jgi:sulfite reductase beta subunit-like hemoprotein